MPLKLWNESRSVQGSCVLYGNRLSLLHAEGFLFNLKTVWRDKNWKLSPIEIWRFVQKNREYSIAKHSRIFQDVLDYSGIVWNILDSSLDTRASNRIIRNYHTKNFECCRMFWNIETVSIVWLDMILDTWWSNLKN